MRSLPTHPNCPLIDVIISIAVIPISCLLCVLLTWGKSGCYGNVYNIILSVLSSKTLYHGSHTNQRQCQYSTCTESLQHYGSELRADPYMEGTANFDLKGLQSLINHSPTHYTSVFA